MTYDFLNNLYDDLLRLIKGICVKRYDLALAAETLETSRAFDIYLSCMNGTAYFYTFPSYDYEAMINAGFDPTTAASYATSPSNIPAEDREKAAKYQAQYTIEHYEERNEYYRTLCGLPPIGSENRYIYPVDENGKYYEVRSDSTTFTTTDEITTIDLPAGYDFVNDAITLTRMVDLRTKTLVEGEDYYVDQENLTIVLVEPIEPSVSVTLTIRHNDEPIPIHEFTADQVGRLETFGILDRIKEQYPDADYLNYLGVSSIDPMKARLARPFDLLRIGDPSNPRVIELFQREYYFARRYVTANRYNRSQVSDSTLYDPTIGMLILTLTIRNIFVLDEKSYLDFDEILNVILESYGMLKYFKKYPFIYKRRLVIALDTLLENKGTDGVLIDVCKVFSPTQDLIADRYYLMKTQKRDPDGSVVESSDPDDMYDLTFLKARISDKDIHTSEEYRVNYKAVTESDYLWQIKKYEDDGVTITDEYRRLLEDPYNLRMTKYVDAQAAYDITSLTFEICCFMNMLLESRFKITKMILSNQYATGMNISLQNKFAADGSSQLFTMLVFLLATLAQRAGYDGNIVYDPETIEEIWGRKTEEAEVWHFDYRDMREQIQEIIDEYELQLDIDDVLFPSYAPPTIPDDNFTLSSPTSTPTARSLVQNYVENRELFEAMQKIMNSTQDLEQYQGIKRIRDILFTRYVQEETFVKADGTLAETYRDLLDDLDPRLGAKLDSIAEDEDEMNGVAVYILEQLQDYFRSDDLHYLFLNTPEVYVSLINRYIEIAINVFKASSVQLRNISVMFLYGENDPIRVFDQHDVHYNAHFSDEVHVKDEASFNFHLTVDEYVTVGDKVYYK